MPTFYVICNLMGYDPPEYTLMHIVLDTYYPKDFPEFCALTLHSFSHLSFILQHIKEQLI